MTKTKYLWLLISSLILMTVSCKKDDVFIPANIQDSKGFYIINEGVFTQGNGSLSFYDFEQDSVLNNLFENINERPLGDVFQSMTFHNGKGFLVVNNSGKIEVVDSASMKSIQTLDAFISPRQILFHNNKAYVTDLYSDKIYILDANTYAEIGSIAVDGSTEDIVEHQGKIIVAINQSVEYTEESQQGLLIIEPSADTISQYVHLSEGAVNLEVDKVGNIWVHCTGHWSDPDATGKLYKVSGEDYSVLNTFEYGQLTYFGSPLRLNQTKDVLYIALPGDPSSFTEFNIHKMSIYADKLSDEIYFSGKDRYINGYDFDESKNELIILDAVDGGQKGELVRVHASTQEVLGEYPIGYFPTSIVFKY